MIAVYARVSTEEQAKHGFSLADQLRECKRKAGTDDVLEYVDEGISGEFLDRPQLSKLREDIRSGLVHKVVCLDPDRLSRKLMNQLIISDEIESRAELMFVNGEYARTPEGQLFYQMRGAISQFEKAKINERMSRGRREKARQGRVLRDFHIYGYDFDSEKEQFVVNSREATIVKLIFDLFTNSNGRVQGINGIAKYLTDIGVPTKRGVGVFHRQVVRQMLMNRSYIGEFYQNRWNTEGMLGNRYRPPEERIAQKPRPREEWIRLPIPAIIDSEQFQYAQSLLAESRRRWAGTGKRSYMLSGLLRCGECGNTMTGRKGKAWGREQYYYSDRKATAGANNPGCGTDIKCDELEHQVWDTILSWIRAPDEELIAELENNPQLSSEQRQLENIQTELERLEVVSRRLMNFLSDPDIDEQDIREKLKDVQIERRSLNQKKLAITSRLDKMNSKDMREEAEHRRTMLMTIWDSLASVEVHHIGAQAGRDLLRTVIKEIRVFEQGQRIEIVTL